MQHQSTPCFGTPVPLPPHVLVANPMEWEGERGEGHRAARPSLGGSGKGMSPMGREGTGAGEGDSPIDSDKLNPLNKMVKVEDFTRNLRQRFGVGMSKVSQLLEDIKSRKMQMFDPKETLGGRVVLVPGGGPEPFPPGSTTSVSPLNKCGA